MKRIRTVFGLMIPTLLVGFWIPVRAGDGPTIDKTSIQVTTRRQTAYFKTPKSERDDSTWSWTPRVRFRVNGPIPSGGQLSVEFFTSDGKPWVAFDCDTGEIKSDEWWETEGGNELPETSGTIGVGLFEFRIKLKNELQGADQTLFTGKIKIGKVHVGNDHPDYKNNFDFFVDHDWNLPIGYVFAPDPIYHASGGSDYVDSAPLCAAMWFRGDPNDVVGHLFYKGKEIGNTKTTATGIVAGEVLNTTFDDSAHVWTRQRFWFTNVLVFNRETPDNRPDAFRLDRNPGEYEIKVLNRGKLARSMKFAVGSDGRIVDTGVGAQNKLGTSRIVVPVTVLGESDGAWDKEAWKSGAFYANPLAGFAPSSPASPENR